MLEVTIDWKLFWVIFFAAIPGIIMSYGGFTRAYWPYIKTHIKNPGKFITVTLFSFGILLITVLSITVGVMLAPSINARFIYFQSLIIEKNMTKAFLFEFLPALIVGFISAILFLFSYYSLFRKTLLPGQNAALTSKSYSSWFKQEIDEKTIFSIEKNRNHLGLSVRIFFNAVVGEIIFRWGIQSLFTFIFLYFTNHLTFAIISAILMSSVFFGILHLLPFWFSPVKKTNFLMISTVVLYFCLSLVFGILFWKYGILSSMIAHGLFHLIWYPLDIFYYRKIPGEV
ncbi:MAG: CPBP family intramembrane metalloprotease [Spirochaetia bacterium]|nr:CPBP family intramembrane metalloprotease [Spirochaetia bacterium]